MSIDTAWLDHRPEDVIDRMRSLSPAELAAAVEGWKQRADEHAHALGLAHQYAGAAGDALLAALGDGEAVQAPSGRFAIRTIGRDGRAVVRADAFDDLDPDTLPPHLRPRQQVKRVLPGVTDLRKAAGDGLITWDLFRLLVAEGPKVPRLSWRKLPTDGGEE